MIGVDLGGTKIAVGSSTATATCATTRAETPTASQEELLAALDEAVEELLGADVAAIGIGVPSIIDQRPGRALGSVNIPLGGRRPRDR